MSFDPIDRLVHESLIVIKCICSLHLWATIGQIIQLIETDPIKIILIILCLNLDLIDAKVAVIYLYWLFIVVIKFDPEPWLILGLPQQVPDDQKKDIEKDNEADHAPFNSQFPLKVAKFWLVYWWYTRFAIGHRYYRWLSMDGTWLSSLIYHQVVGWFVLHSW